MVQTAAAVPNGEAPVRQPMDFVIVATPRTGSYLLCDGLDDTGIAGVPTEVFNPSATYDLRKDWSVDTDAGLDEYLAAAREHGTTSNGVFGFKILRSQILQFEKLADSPGEGPDILDRFFPDAKFINIIRRDRIAQAISRYRALTTKEWWRIAGVNDDRPSPPSPDFDARAILMCALQLCLQQLSWERYLARRRRSYLIVEYEQLAANYRSEIARVLAYLGLDPTAAQRIPDPRLLAQADEETKRWRELLRASIERPET